jgi:hypothetical protein
MATSQVHGNHKDSLLVMLHTSILQRMQDLTQLHLSTDYGPGTELLQHVGSMTDLRDLRVGGCNSGLIQRGPLQLAVSQLTALTKLQRLGLRGVRLADGTSTAEAAANAAALLAWLPSLQALSSLQLRKVDGLTDDPRAGSPTLYPAPTAYSALTVLCGTSTSGAQ